MPSKTKKASSLTTNLYFLLLLIIFSNLHFGLNLLIIMTISSKLAYLPFLDRIKTK